MASTKAKPRQLPRFIRIIRVRWRLVLATCLGLAVTALLPTEWRWATRELVGWDFGVGLYLMAAYAVIARADVDHIKREAARQDEGAVLILILTAAAAFASLGAILAELAATHGTDSHPVNLALAAVTIVLSWGFTHTIFALHYAHEFYGEGGKKAGLAFPGDQEPDYWDFVYFSFVIGMTSQVSDVAVTARRIRRTVSAHGVVSFIFNAALLALTVNIAASAI
jgi:uncharacterized membrane protein